MSQISTGTVFVTNGSATVTGNNTQFVTDGVSVGDLFIPEESLVSYEVASITNETELQLTAPYQGTTIEGADYVIHTSFTPNKSYPFPETGDFETATIVKRAIKKIDEDNYLDTSEASVAPAADSIARRTTAGRVRSVSGGSGDEAVVHSDTGTAPDELPTNADIDARGFAQSVDSVSTLRISTFPASLERLWLSGYYGVGTAGGGPLYRDSADTTTADNGGTVFVGVDGARWKRNIEGVINVKWFGAQGDGATDDTDRIKDAISNAPKSSGVYFPEGEYHISDAILVDKGSLFSITGDGVTSRIKQTSDNDVFQIDTRGGRIFWNQYRDLWVEGNEPMTDRAGFRILASTESTDTGMRRSQFFNVSFRSVTKCIAFDKTAKMEWEGIAQIDANSFISMSNLEAHPGGINTIAHSVWFEAGANTHHIISNSNLRGSVSAIKMGDGENDTSVGDQLIVGNHIISSDIGIDIQGPGAASTTDTSIYNRSINILGNHFDVISTATVRMNRMSDFRIIGNNSLRGSTDNIDLSDCWQYQVDVLSASESKFQITQKNSVTGAGSVNLFEVSWTEAKPEPDTAERRVSVLVEAWVDGYVDGWTGNRYVYWRGAITRNNNGLTLDVFEKNSAQAADMDLTWALDETTNPRATLAATIANGNSSSDNRIRGTVRIIGYQYEGKIL